MALCGLLSGHDAVTSAMRAAQGLGIELAGLVAVLTTPATAVAGFAAVGVIIGISAATGWHRAWSATATAAV